MDNVEVSVLPKTLIFKNVFDTFEYDGTAPKVTYELQDGFGKQYDVNDFIVTGNNVNFVDAGSYTIVLKIEKNQLFFQELFRGAPKN